MPIVDAIYAPNSIAMPALAAGILIGLAASALFSFCCVALFNAWNSIQQLMIRIDADEHFAVLSAGYATQGTLSRVVKEDLKRIQLHPLKKYQSKRIVREQQIYGLTCIYGNKAVTLPVQTNDL